MKTTKSILVVVLAMMLTTSSFATIRTVSNSPSTTIAQFSTIQAAINASSNGDTVYVHGSPITYAGFTLTNKRLVIIGPGWSPDKILPFKATVDLSIITGALCTRSEIQGLSFIGRVEINSSKPDSLRLIRNAFAAEIRLNQGATTYRGYLIEGNLFTSDNSLNGNASSIYLNFIVQNNYFYHNINANPPCNFSSFNNPSSTVLIDHNLWFGPNSGSKNCFLSCAFLTITNNIFVRRNAGNDNSQSVFNNNITFLSANDAPWTMNGNIDGGGNHGNEDPQMVDQTLVNSGSNNPLGNFTISSGPGENGGSDGKDIGLLYDTTGSLNWTNSRNSRLPRIFSMIITTPTLPVGGTVTVVVEARKSN